MLKIVTRIKKVLKLLENTLDIAHYVNDSRLENQLIAVNCQIGLILEELRDYNNGRKA